VKNSLRVYAALIVICATLAAPDSASAQSWQCQIQIPKSGNISSWCGMSPVNLRVSGSRGSGWVGMDPFNLSFSSNRASGWIGMNPVSLSKSGSSVSGWVGQTPVNCRVTGRNNFCLTFIATDPN
jgi:hypothetical protein